MIALHFSTALVFKTSRESILQVEQIVNSDARSKNKSDLFINQNGTCGDASSHMVASTSGHPGPGKIGQCPRSRRARTVSIPGTSSIRANTPISFTRWRSTSSIRLRRRPWRRRAICTSSSTDSSTMATRPGFWWVFDNFPQKLQYRISLHLETYD